MNTDPDIASDSEPGCLPPRERYDLFAHADIEQQFLSAWESGRLHHAWLICGPRGVGKATLAWRIARRVLGAGAFTDYGPLGADPSDPVCRQLEAHANPDLLLLRRPWDEKRKRWRAEITVDEARRAPSFFEKSAGAGGWRVCLVDSADDMNTNAANALLKTLEEPPKRGLLILISHAPGRLPATIRSRCRRLDLRVPSIEATANWLVETASVADPITARQASELAGGAPGRALALSVSGGVELAHRIDALVEKGARASESDLRQLAELVTGKAGAEKAPVFYRALRAAIQRRGKQVALAGGNSEPWIDAWRSLSQLVRDSDALYLDPKQTALAALSLVTQAARTEMA
ncbi:DNA polymerase III subunit delta' [Maricaulis sp.]|uniref:DNA polymerase III subunit delta' n=1 Tax=Maricaulis sp. TaxID=1486257 RepID=UPI002630F2F8|nr:DNA polymerase III subunit delta' [Maricaulis sp.]